MPSSGSIKPIRASDYHFLVTLERDTAGTTDTYRQYNESWTDITTVLADLDALRGNELINARQVWATATFQVRIRYMSGTLAPRPNDRFRLPDGSRLNIISVSNDQFRYREWVCICGEIQQPPGQ